MRDRLIEMLSDYLYSEQIADHLLKNGGIVPPCKVGADVYIYIAEIDAVCPAKVTEIYKDCQTISTPVWIELFYKTKNGKSHGVKLSCDVFKLLCFPTKEEAEQALSKLHASYEQVKGGAE
jgi:hypothetical protein